MKTTKMSAIPRLRSGWRACRAILVLALGLMVWPAPVVYGVPYLTVNGADVTSITLELGQSRTVEVVSTDGTSYVAYVGFDNGVVRGTFSYLETKDEAGNLATVLDYNEPAFYGYYVSAAGISPPPSAGVHFVFEYAALEVGTTYVKLYDSTLTSLIDSVRITVTALEPVAMGTAFTYQGRLLDEGSPADGLYDLQFKLYDNPGPFAAQKGSTTDVNDLDVIDGYFTVELDFGSDVFAGDARWLETTVAQSDGSDPCTLTPRVEVTPTPYAIYAEYAETAGVGHSLDAADGYPTNVVYVNNGGYVGIGTTNPGSKLSVLGASYFRDNVGIGTATPAAKLSIQMRGQALPTFPPLIAPGLLIKGGNNNLGNQLEVQSPKGSTRFLVNSAGNVGIGTGTTIPNEKLTIQGALSLDEISAPSATAGYGKVYVKSTDGKLYFKDDAGKEYELIAGGGDFVVGNFLICANDTDRVTPVTGPVPLKETKIGRGGTLRIKFDLRATHPSFPVFAQIRRNNVPVGTARTTNSQAYVTYSEDISGWSKGDLVQVFGYTTNPAYLVYVRNFRLYANNPAEAGARF